jgi:hypothetical protein
MSERSKHTDERAGELATTAQRGRANGSSPTGLVVEGPGFLVWDEVASDARRRAAELSAVAPWRIRSGVPGR